MGKQRILEGYPDASLGLLLSAAFARSEFFSHSLGRFTALHSSGRAALYWAFRGLRLPAGSAVYLPSFHCGVEVQAALDAELSVEFYRIKAELTVDREDLRLKLDRRPGTVVLIHYFGFGQPEIAAITRDCADRGSVAIEDCAHSLFSKYAGRSLGEFAPLSIYSLRKSLPLYDGGALRLNTNLLREIAAAPFEQPQLRRFSFDPYMLRLKREVGRIAGPQFIRLIRKMRGKTPVLPGEPAPPSLGNDFSREHTICYISRRLAACSKPEEIIRQRRRNYSALDAQLRSYPGYSPAFQTLQSGVCPLCLPIRVSGRSNFLRDLRRENILPFIFGAYPHPYLPAELNDETSGMRNAIVGLPIHQQLNDADIARVSRAVGPMLRRHGLQMEPLLHECSTSK